MPGFFVDMNLSKRIIPTLGLLLMFAGCASLSGTFGSGTSPNLRVGVVSDVHLRNEPGFDAFFLKALRWFDAKKVDAVVIPGDLTDQTMNMQLEHFKRYVMVLLFAVMVKAAGLTVM